MRDIFNRTNMVAFRVWITMGCVIITTFAYVILAPLTNHPWTPTWEWLLFLLTLSGVDVSAYAVKRMTHISDDGEVIAQKIKGNSKLTPPAPVENNSTAASEELATTDIQELIGEDKG